MGTASCIGIETDIDMPKQTIVSASKLTQNNIICLPESNAAKDEPIHDHATEMYQRDDDDLQLAIALSLNSQYTSKRSISNISMLCGIDGILLFEESTLLIHGFIRQVKNQHLRQYIIPLELNNLCFKYFYIPTSLSKLIQARNTAELLLDSFRVFEIEKLIFNKVCSTKYNNNNLQMCQLVLNNWSLNEKIEQYRHYINQCVQRCLLKDNVMILQVILSNVIYDTKYDQWDTIRMNEIMQFINNAAKYGAYKCIMLLLQNSDKLDWSNELRNPTVLYNAVKYQNKKLYLINFIVDSLQAVKIRFICGDIMEEIIRYDLVGIAKRIINNRWHTLNESDKSYAKFMNLKCHQWIIQRSDAFNYYVYDEGNILDLEDDEWDNKSSNY